MKKDPSVPPALAEKILRGMNGRGEEYAFLGDLNEEYATLARTKGLRRARAWYWGQILAGFPSYLKDSAGWSWHMLKNYLVVTWRNVKRHKGFSFINIAGLAVGMAACLIIMLWVRDELSYNRFHKNAERLYLVVSERVSHRGEFYDDTPVPLAEPLRNDYPEIGNVVRFNFRENVIARREEKAFTDWKGAYVDPEVLQVFTFPLSKGDARTALDEPNAIVLTETAARNLFGGTDPLGQTMEIEEGDLVEVTGVLRDIPDNSDILVHYFRPLRAMKELVTYRSFIWNWFSCSTYVLLNDGADAAGVQAKIAGLLNTNRPWSKDPLDVSLFALEDAHLRRPGGGGPIKYIYIFAAVAAMIMLIACINFMNLSTARSAKRAREVGLRKVVGSRRLQLIKQFFMESTLFALLAAVVAVLLTLVTRPLFNQLAGKPLRLDISDPGLLVGLAGMVILSGIVAGSYPALVLSSFRPADVLKGDILLRKGTNRGAAATGARFRQGLVITQFVLSIGLIIYALFVLEQLDYMRHGDIGFDKDNLVRLSLTRTDAPKAEALKAELARSPHIAGATAYGPTGHGGNIDWDGASGDLVYLGDSTIYLMVDFDYVKTHKMEIVAGRDFSREFPSDATSAYLLNEEALKRWSFQNPVGKRFALNKAPGSVIGVYKNQHFGLRDEIRPCVLYLNPATQWDAFRYVAARLKAGHVPEALQDIERTWKAQIAEAPLECRFVNEMIDALYQSEERLSGLINAFTLLAIGVSCLGLFGMASFMAQQKTKEIGVRTALGASVSRIVFLMTGETVRWVLLANIIAWPVAYSAVRSWLSDYPYRIKIGVEVFIISGLAALTVATLTVIYQAIKAAVADPTRSLRYE
jgi:ABC-type antimicrobial peptide transport system permease subunit